MTRSTLGGVAQEPAHRVVLLTQHGKESLLAPLLGQSLGWAVERVDGFDTDTLGSFTREVDRPGSQLEAARTKARTGMALAGWWGRRAPAQTTEGNAA